MNPLRRVVDAFRSPQQLDGGGERVDIDLRRGDPPFDSLDLYQRSHWRRYEFALEQIAAGTSVADLACGTGYGSVLLARRAAHVTGVDIDPSVVAAARRRYRKHSHVEFQASDLRGLEFNTEFDVIVSFETLEHFDEQDIQHLLRLFGNALKPRGRLVFSTPYLQERSREAVELGFHETFLIDEGKIERWLQDASFSLVALLYQDYATHVIREERGAADFIIGVAEHTDA